MKLAEAWRLSRVSYREVVYRSLAEERGRMWWGAFGRSQVDKEAQNDLELTNRALRIARFDKIIVSIFNVLVSLVPFATFFLGAKEFGLASSISLSLAVTFGFTTLYAIQTLSSFVSAESSVLLATLPIAQDDFSLVTLFSFVRSVDYMVVGSILSQVIVVAFVARAPLAILIMLLAASMNELFAVTIALWFSRTFQKNLLRGGRSKAYTVLRLGFIFMWGLLLVGVGFIFSIPWYIVPNLQKMLLSVGHVSTSLLCLLYPFSTGVLVSSVTYSNVALLSLLLSSVAMAVYALLAVYAGKWSLGTVKSISQGSGLKIARTTTNDFSVKTHRPLFGYVLKDLKVSSRNPGTAFFFALPVLETVIVAILSSNIAVLRIVVMLEATTMGAVFALFMPLALLTAEGRGLEYTKTLPISSRRIVVSKTLVSTATYAPVPLVLIALSTVKHLTSPFSSVIPFLIIMAVASASIFEIKLFLRAAAQGRIRAIINDIQKLIVGVSTIFIPEIAYVVVYFLTFNQSFNQIFSLSAMGIVALSELAVAVHLLGRS